MRMRIEGRARARFCAGPVEGGFSLPELMIAMAITITLMTIVFGVLRQNQNVFATESGVTAMNENVRAAVDLVSREIQAAGTGMLGMSAPILGVDARGGETGDRLAVLIGDPFAPLAQVKNTGGGNGVDSVAVLLPPSYASTLRYRDDRGKERELYRYGDRYVLYNGPYFRIVRITGVTRATSGDIVVRFRTDDSNPRPTFGDYAYQHARDGGSGAQLARLDTIVYYRWDKDKQVLERRENDEPWAAVARGIIGFQVRYRVVLEDETLSEPLDHPPTERSLTRALVVTVRARTPDVEPDSPFYRETAERVEITPRNMRLWMSSDAG